MKNFELDEEEKKILKAFESGKLKPLPNAKDIIARHAAYAKAMMDKTKNINLRISQGDLLKIKAKALEKGIPYQTLMASLIHQYSTGRLKQD